jgi:hypothetical protein
MSEERIFEFLRTWCHATIVTKKEDSLLLPRTAMPKGWIFEGGNMFQRYIDAKLFSEIREPLGCDRPGAPVRRMVYDQP